MSAAQRAVYLELTSMGASPQAANVMARRQKVKPEVTTALATEQATDARQAERDRLERDMRQAGPPAVDEKALQPAVNAVADTLATRAAAQRALDMIDPATGLPRGAVQRESTLPQPTQALLKPVVLVEGVYEGGRKDVGSHMVVQVEFTGKANMKKIGDAAVVAGSGGPSAAPSAPSADSAAAMMGGGGPGTSSAAPTRPASKGMGSDGATLTMVEVGAMVTGLAAPQVVIPAMILRTMLQRATADRGGLE